MKVLDRIDEYVQGEAPKLEKRHFVAIAKIMKKSKTLDALKNELLSFLQSSNPNFDMERFKKAAGMKKTGNDDIKKRVPDRKV